MAFSKIGWLTGVGGNPGGIGSYVQALDSAGIPAAVMANDSTTGLSDIWNLDTSVEHVMLFRVVRDGVAYDVPDYNLPPAQAASLHWDKIKAYFPPEIMVHRDRVWIQPVNEPDRGRADWLGQFGVEIAKIANVQGYKVALFGWSSGEPEPSDWRLPGVVQYLQYCHANHDMAAVALHEYDFHMVGMANTYPWHVGRFEELFRACEEHNISRPLVFVSEFGWAYNSVPNQSQCMADIDYAARLYAKYPEVMGAATWYLGPGFGSIANKVQPLMEPVKNYTLNTVFPDPEEPPMPTLQETLWNASQTEWTAQKARPGDIKYPLALGGWKEQMRNVKRVPAHNEKSLVFEGTTYAYQGFFDPFGELPYIVQAWSSKTGHFVVNEPVPGGEPPPGPF